MMRFKPTEEETREGRNENIFGWRVSLIGLVVLLALGALVVYRHYTLGVPTGFDDPGNTPINRSYYQEKADREAAEADSLRRLKREQRELREQR